MEDPCFPRDPGGGMLFPLASVTDINCRVEELAAVLRDSTKITPSRFTWLTPQDFCQSAVKGHQHRPVVVDTRTEDEALGGRVIGAVRASTRLAANELEQLIAHYRAGSSVIFYCLRSQSRAPLAAQSFLQAIDQQGGGACSGGHSDVVDPRVCVVEGGLVALLQCAIASMPSTDQKAMTSLHDLDSPLLGAQPCNLLR